MISELEAKKKLWFTPKFKAELRSGTNEILKKKFRKVIIYKNLTFNTQEELDNFNGRWLND